MWPINSNVNTTILHDDFYSSVERSTVKRFFPGLTTEKTMADIVTVFTSFGSVPEIRQLSGVVGGGARQAVPLKDYQVTGTAYEWEQTVPIRRSIAMTKPEDVRRKTTQMASKALKGMDRTLCQALISTTVLGYDGIAMYSTAHAETGASQTNTCSTAAGVGGSGADAFPTATEVETALITGVAQLLGVTDDQGTPVNEGVSRFKILCNVKHLFAIKTVVSELMSNQAVDSSGVTGRFRGLVDVIPSAYCTTTGLPAGFADRAFLFPADGETDEFAMALCKAGDWQFNTNIGNDSSDDWNKGEGFLYSWGLFGYIPWQWQATQQLIWT